MRHDRRRRLWRFKGISSWAKRHPLRALVLFDLVMVATTALLAVIALGPDSLLEDCSSRSYSRCIGSHGQAGGMAIGSGVITLYFLAITWSRIRSRGDRQR